MALVQPASLQLFQKLAESMLSSRVAGEEMEATGGGEAETPGASVCSGGGGGTAAVGATRLWAGLGSGKKTDGGVDRQTKRAQRG